MKAKQKKQAVKKQPNGFKKTTIKLKHDVYLKLLNACDLTGRKEYELIDQALRNLLKMQTPTIEEEIKNMESK